MHTVHNAIYHGIIKDLAIKHFEDIAAGGYIRDTGEGAPPGAFEPWMETEAACYHEVIGGERVAALRFRAGPEGQVFQEAIMVIHENSKEDAVLKFTKPNDEYRLCEVVAQLIHLIVAQVASRQGKPGCCCPDQDGVEHDHPEFVVLDEAAGPMASNVVPLFTA